MNLDVRPRAPTELAELLDAPLAFMREHLRDLAPVAVVGALVMALPNVLMSAAMPTLAGTGPEAQITSLAVTYAVSFIVMAIYLAFQLALYAQVRAVMDGHPRALGAALLQGLIPRRYFTMVIKYLIYAAGFCLCGIPTLYFGLVLSWLAAILVHEDVAWFGAIRRSIRLAHRSPRGVRFGNTILRVVIAWHVAWAIVAAVAGITSIPLFALYGLEVWRDILSGTPPDPAAMQAAVPLAVSLPLTLLGGVLSGIAQLYPATLFTALYRDVRDMSEGHDLDAALAARLERNAS